MPDEWTLGTISPFVALSGNRPWGGMKTPGDVPYLGLYCPGHETGRTFSNLVPKRKYFLSFYAAERRGYGEAELLTVKVNGHVVADKLSPLAEFTKHTYTFTPNDLGEAAVEFMNDSPATHKCGNTEKNHVATVLFTLLKIYPTRDCGAGASCHNPLPPATTFTCRCDAGETHGKAVVGGAASCTDKDDLPEQLAEVKAQVSAVERSFSSVSDDVSGLKIALKAATLAADGQAADVATLQDRMAAVEGKLDALLAALKAGQVPSSALAVPTESNPGGGAGADIPEIVADGEGGLAVHVKRGKRVTVNGDSLLTANDITALIQKAVEAALQNVAE